MSKLTGIALQQLPEHMTQTFSQLPITRLIELLDAAEGHAAIANGIARSLPVPTVMTIQPKSSNVQAFAEAYVAALASKPSPNALRAVEHAILRAALLQCNGNVSATARLLGVDRKALERKKRRMK